MQFNSPWSGGLGSISAGRFDSISGGGFDSFPAAGLRVESMAGLIGIHTLFKRFQNTGANCGAVGDSGANLDAGLAQSICRLWSNLGVEVSQAAFRP